MIKKYSKKFLFMLVILMFIINMCTTVFASNEIEINSLSSNETNSSTTTSGTTTLEVVEDNICNIEIGDIANFEKKITEFNKSEKSATLTLTLTNTKSIEENQKDVEIFFVIDNSSSMTSSYVGSGTRKDAVIKSANSLIDKLFKANNKAKIGIVGFSSLDSSAGETEGTINDATLSLGLSSSKDEVSKAVSDLANLKTGPRTNIEAGLTIAQDNFSSTENVDRYIVLLTDGVPNNATDGTFATYSGTVATRTKSKIEDIQSNGIKIIGAMINLDSETVEPTTSKTYRALSEEIFGTVENPTTDTYYYITDDEIENTIVNDIYNDLIVRKDNTLKNITIKDYFPQEIIDNFDFEYVASPNIGTVSQKIDKEDNSITWNIELLSEGEVAKLSYKLTLKSDYDKNIIDKILPTNTKVDITGDNNNQKLTGSSDVSPTLRVKYEEIEVINNTIVDNTIADKDIPQTGENTIELVISMISIISMIAIARIIYLRKLFK